jgi:hypothetical protein
LEELVADTELYSMLVDYALRAGAPRIPLLAFQKSFLTSTMLKARKNPGREQWAKNPREKFQQELDKLIGDGKITMQTDAVGGHLYVPAFFVERVRKLWVTVDDNPALPFPDNDDLQIDIPEELIKNVYFATDFQELLKTPPTGELPILRIIFPEKTGFTLVTASIISTRFLESAIYKMSAYFDNNENFQVLGQKVRDKVPAMLVKLNAAVKMIAENHNDCLREIKNGNGDLFLVLTILCNILTGDLLKIEQKKDSDAAIAQSAYVMTAFAAYYRETTLSEDSTEECMAALNNNFNDAPYIYDIGMINKFTDNNGDILIQKYLDDFSKALNKMTSSAVNGSKLPVVMTFYDEKHCQWFVLKEKLYQTFALLVSQSKEPIFNTISARWKGILRNYDRDGAMLFDADFETLVIRIGKEKNALLVAIYSNKRFSLAKNELDADAQNSPMMYNFFWKDNLLPLHAILGLSRSDIKNKVLRELPFWYSLPIIVGIIRLFKGKRKSG